MTQTTAEPGQGINADMQVCDVIYHNRATEAVFKQYEEQTGHCICCESLFDSLRSVAKQYDLDLDVLLKELREVAVKE